MLYGFLLLAFVLSATLTSSLAYSERAWRHAFVVTLLCAIPLIVWIAGALRSSVRYFSGDIAPLPAIALASLPFVLIVVHLCHRRQNTPRHTPGPEDDPLYRRFRAEKLRRYRLRRQQEEQEELLETGEDPLGPIEPRLTPKPPTQAPSASQPPLHPPPTAHPPEPQADRTETNDRLPSGVLSLRTVRTQNK